MTTRAGYACIFNLDACIFTGFLGTPAYLSVCEHPKKTRPNTSFRKQENIQESGRLMAKCGRAAPATSGAVDMDRGVSTRAKSCCASSTRGTDRHDRFYPFFLSNINSMASVDADTEMESFACGGRAGVWCDRGSDQCFSALAKDKRRFGFCAKLGGWGMQKFCSTSTSVSPGAM